MIFFFSTPQSFLTKLISYKLNVLFWKAIFNNLLGSTIIFIFHFEFFSFCAKLYKTFEITFSSVFSISSSHLSIYFIVLVFHFFIVGFSVFVFNSIYV